MGNSGVSFLSIKTLTLRRSCSLLRIYTLQKTERYQSLEKACTAWGLRGLVKLFENIAMEGFEERLACKWGRLFERNPRLYVAGKKIPNQSLLACVFPQWSFTTKGFVPWPNSLRTAKDLSLHEGFEERDWPAKEVAIRRQIAKPGAGLRRPQRQLF